MHFPEADGSRDALAGETRWKFSENFIFVIISVTRTDRMCMLGPACQNLTFIFGNNWNNLFIFLYRFKNLNSVQRKM